MRTNPRSRSSRRRANRKHNLAMALAAAQNARMVAEQQRESLQLDNFGLLARVSELEAGLAEANRRTAQYIEDNDNLCEELEGAEKLHEFAVNRERAAEAAAQAAQAEAQEAQAQAQQAEAAKAKAWSLYQQAEEDCAECEEQCRQAREESQRLGVESQRLGVELAATQARLQDVQQRFNYALGALRVLQHAWEQQAGLAADVGAQ